MSLSKNAKERIENLIGLYPKKKSAVMPALYIAQEEKGYLTDEAITWVSEVIGESPAHVRGVATFYTMYYKAPVGQYHIQVCRTLSCMICGARKITKAIKERLEIAAGEISEDGLWSFEEVECLGSCGSAPMVQINDVFFENLTEKKLNSIMDTIEKEKPDLRYSTLGGRLGEGLPNHPRSEVV